MKADIRRIVIKIGSSGLNRPEGGLNDAALAQIVDIIVAFRQKGVEVVLVSSGAVAAGMGKLGLDSRPKDIAGKQAAAAVGQGVLIERYAQLLEEHNIVGAQVLLTRIDLADPERYRNSQNTLERLLKYHVVPIINENDTVAVEELCFGDNDRLSALVAGLVHAEQLVIMTDVDGLFTSNPKQDPNAKLVEEVQDVSEVLGMAGGVGSNIGTGGMVTKLKAAEIATRFGIGVLLLNSSLMNELPNIVEGKKPKGTYFLPARHRLVGRKRWIAYGGLSEGSVIIDDGASKALIGEGKSLLAKGITGIEGTWDRKELVRIINSSGQEIARGLSELSSDEVLRVKGRHSDEMRQLVPGLEGEEVIHRDNMTLMGEPGAK